MARPNPLRPSSSLFTPTFVAPEPSDNPRSLTRGVPPMSWLMSLAMFTVVSSVRLGGSET
jgi:hypothetical protein